MGLEKITGMVEKSAAESEKYHLIEDVLKCTGVLLTFGLGYMLLDNKFEDNIPGIVYG